MTDLPSSVDELRSRLEESLYFADRDLTTAIYLALQLERPLLLEGEAGVGKTEVAKVLAAVLGRRLIRLQCYEGLDQAAAVYEWDYARQLLHLKLLEAAGRLDAEASRDELFGERFLLRRPLLQAIDSGDESPPVLLLDELDRADAEFEAFLLELLSDFQITVPEIGTLHAAQRPIVVVTSNRTREVHDALRRRCLYHWIDYPAADEELRIVTAKVPEAGERLARQVTAFVQELRRHDLYKRPGVAETLDWIAALVALERRELDATTAHRTLGSLLKYRDDLERVRGDVLERTLERAEMAG